MYITQSPRYLGPLLFVMLVAILVSLTGGAASAQEAAGDDYGTWYVQGTAAKLGGLLDASGSGISGRIDNCVRGTQTCEDRDGFLIYFGNMAGAEMHATYTVSVDTSVPDLVITVSTFYDSLHIEEYAAFLRTDVRVFAEEIGLNPVCDALNPDFPIKVCDLVQKVPVGHIFARNSDGGNSVTFTPVAGDIGAYLIMLRSDDIHASGTYWIAVSSGS